MDLAAQRMRLVQSLDVDDTNPDYIRKKEQGMVQLKNSFDAIIDKYENMPTAMSDEIDMHSGKIVVDRGHLRSIAEQEHTMQAAQFLDDFLNDDSTRNVNIEDDTDELAPPETPPQLKEKKTGSQDAPEQLVATSSPAALPSHPQKPSLAITPHLLNTGPLAIQLPQLPQLAQTSMNPEQSAFLTNLNQVMNQAINQFATNMVNTMSNLLGTAPGTLAPAATALSLAQPATTAIPGDTLTPGADPKWWFPPLPPRSSLPRTMHSSPTSAPTIGRKRRRSLSKLDCNHVSKRPARVPTEVALAEEDVTSDIVKAVSSEDGSVGRFSVLGSAATLSDTQTALDKSTFHPLTKYRFTSEDDKYIVEGKEIHKLSWGEIKSGRKHWTSWPLWSIQQRYSKRLKMGKKKCGKKNADTPGDRARNKRCDQPKTKIQEERAELATSSGISVPRVSEVVQQESRPSVLQETPPTTSAPREHLEILTPTSLEPANGFHSSPELHEHIGELLQKKEQEKTVESTCVQNEPEPVIFDQPDDYPETIPGPEEIILTSIETDRHLSEESEEEEIDGPTVTRVPTPPASTKATQIPRGPGLLHHLRAARQAPKQPSTHQPANDSEDELGLICTHDPAPQISSPAAPTADPEATYIKPEPRSSPPPISLLNTPRSAPQLSCMAAATPARSTPRADRKNYARIKASWGKKSRGAARPLTKSQLLERRRSLQVLKGKKDGGESEDELA
ncbi:hypothetical protein EJ04DRAFT_521870 [Polyplosphaeria fusca]|uniref:Uncharacterized protein n=1 Tax=Polyplosphaeria fusca TaxID=682080 RepID=A0A9P4R4I1_9PLEO|nr:hypothetical protein EJ04DRAFT_521870 [Polyplosphaeria fusca]